jgi:hypothetical protein
MIYKEKLIQILSTNEAIKKKAEEYNFIKINRLSIDGEELKN